MNCYIRSKLALAFFILSICHATQSYAGGPENLLLVVNSQSAKSKIVANHYISLRQIPSSNVLYLDSVPDKERMSIKDFRSEVLEPVLKAIDERKLGQQIDIIAYSADFPTAIGLPKESNQVIPEKFRNKFKPTASINSATFFAQQLLREDFTFMEPAANCYFRTSSQQALVNFYVGETGEKYNSLTKAYKDGEYDKALDIATAILGIEKGPQPVFRYWAAQCLAQLDRGEDAMAMLDQAIREGWSFSRITQESPAFKKLLDSKDFKSLISSMTEIDRSPPMTFDSKFIWSPSGFVTTDPSKGRRYFLSMVLGVARGKGNSVAEIIQSLETSARADGTNPKGTFYYSSNKDIRGKTRAPLMNEAVAALQRIGKSAEVIKSNMPASKADVLGLMAGVARFDWEKTKSTILPGAICEHLTSWGGVMKGEPGKGQTTVSEFIRHGAAGASGTVTEPFAFHFKFPHPMMHYYYAKGCNLVESFYQSVHGPYQLLIVGDPLCRPFAKIPEFTVQGIDDPEKVTGVIKLGIEPAPNSGITDFDIYHNDRFVRSLKSGQVVSFDTQAVSDGYHEIRFVAKTAGPIVFSNRKIIGIQVQNRARVPKLEKVPAEHDITKEVIVRLTKPWNFSLVAVQNGSELKSRIIQDNTNGSEAKTIGLAIPCTQLGSGPSRIKIFAAKGDRRICLDIVETVVKGPLP